jgi:hypothetical protein
MSIIDKVSHVKNPLTVIAVFASLAEISGTVVLPLIEKETQQTFVWFLMIFPTLLVLSFFGTLIFKPHVLYAPSDYKDENIFASFFKPASPERQRKKLEEEVAQDGQPEALRGPSEAQQNATADEPARQPDDAPPPHSLPAPQSPPSAPVSNSGTTYAQASPQTNTPSRPTSSFISRDHQAIYRDALAAEMP